MLAQSFRCFENSRNVEVLLKLLNLEPPQGVERSAAVERLEQLEPGSVFDSANHVWINVDEAAMQVLVGLNCGCMVTVLPKRSLAVFALIVFLGGAAGN